MSAMKRGGFKNVDYAGKVKTMKNFLWKIKFLTLSNYYILATLVGLLEHYWASTICKEILKHLK